MAARRGARKEAPRRPPRRASAQPPGRRGLGGGAPRFTSTYNSHLWLASSSLKRPTFRTCPLHNGLTSSGGSAISRGHRQIRCLEPCFLHLHTNLFLPLRELFETSTGAKWKLQQIANSWMVQSGIQPSEINKPLEVYGRACRWAMLGEIKT